MVSVFRRGTSGEPSVLLWLRCRAAPRRPVGSLGDRHGPDLNGERFDRDLIRVVVGYSELVHRGTPVAAQSNGNSHRAMSALISPSPAQVRYTSTSSGRPQRPAGFDRERLRRSRADERRATTLGAVQSIAAPALSGRRGPARRHSCRRRAAARHPGPRRARVSRPARRASTRSGAVRRAWGAAARPTSATPR